jgi:hypothetical protein
VTLPPAVSSQLPLGLFQKGVNSSSFEKANYQPIRIAMKKTIFVNIEVYVEIDIEDEYLTPEAVAEFSKFMFPIASADDLFKYAAGVIAKNEDYQEIEGIGYATSCKAGIDSAIKYNVLNHELTSDIDAELEA